MIQAFLTAGILTGHWRKSTCVSNNINNGSVVLEYLSKPCQRDSEPKCKISAKAAKWKSAMVIFFLLTPGKRHAQYSSNAATGEHTSLHMGSQALTCRSFQLLGWNTCREEQRNISVSAALSPRWAVRHERGLPTVRCTTGQCQAWSC